jgi:hypothetical protein
MAKRKKENCEARWTAAQVQQRIAFAKSKGYIYIGNGFFQPINTYIYAEMLVINQQSNSNSGTFPPVKYNGCFLDNNPQ